MNALYKITVKKDRMIKYFAKDLEDIFIILPTTIFGIFDLLIEESLSTDIKNLQDLGSECRNNDVNNV